MMVSEKKERARIHKFVCRQLNAGPDLSTLTFGILKRQYLAHVQCESLSPEAKNFMKKVIQKELMKMQENGHELETKMPQNKRKREEENDKVICETQSRTKKSRHQLSSSSESEDKENHKTGNEENEEREEIKTGYEEQEVKKTNKKQQIKSENPSGEEKNESETSESESSCADSPKAEVKKKPKTTEEKKKTPQSDEEDEADSESESEKRDKNNVNDSSDGEKEGNVSAEKEINGSDSDSSSEDEEGSETKTEQKGSATKTEQNTKKKKKGEKRESSKTQKDSNKAVKRLKHYISLCGVRHNYKKMLEDCRSIKSMVAVLKKELENLGVEGNPTITKCKAIRKKREQDKELAELDVGNIIATEGRPTRRGVSALKKQQDPPSSVYQRSLNSDSDSDQENTHKGRRRTMDWTNLQGIISDDEDSN